MKPIQYGYVAGGYVDPGYIMDDAGMDGTRIEFIHATAGTLKFHSGPIYPEYKPQYLQPIETTAAGYPIIFPPVLSQVPFDVHWPDMWDAELESLRIFMFTNVPVFDEWEFKHIRGDLSFQVRFAALKLQIMHVIPGHNDVLFSLVRI